MGGVPAGVVRTVIRATAGIRKFRTRDAGLGSVR